MHTTRTYRYAHQRRAAAAAEAAAADAERAAHQAACGTTHPHNWGNWAYSADYTTETRTCRDCGATETQAVRL